MGRFCYGAYLKILTLCSPKATTQKYLCGTMFLAVNPDYDIRDDDGTVGHLKDCRDNVSPNVTDFLTDVDNDELLRCFENDIIPKLSQDKLNQVVLALKDWLIKDDSIDDTAIIGTIGKKTKGSYRNATDFLLSEFLADFFMFSLLGIDNSTGKPFIDEISKTYIKSFDCQTGTITLRQISLAAGSALTPTLQDKNYKETFEEVTSVKLGLNNPEEFRIFRLKLEDYAFEYNTLHQFLTRNLGRYVHSRAKMRRYKISDDLESVGIEAAQLIRDNGTGDELGTMMLYAFLEKEMNAPKILSSIELGAGRGQCAGIHLMTLGGSVVAHQLVYGTSDVQGSLRSAIDDAFADIIKIKESKPSGMELVDSTAFNCAFSDAAITEKVKRMIIPCKAGQDNAATAYGIFLGYSLKIYDDAYSLSLDEFKDALKKQLEDDINAQKDYIFSKISSLHLGMHSFYIFVLPFNDADQDKKTILTRLVGGTANEQ